MKKTTKIVLFILSLIGILCLIPCLFPKVQQAAVFFVEKLKNDDIHDSFWMKQMFAFAFCFIVLIITFDLIIFTKKGKDIFFNCIDNLKSIYNLVIENRKYFLTIFVLYIFGYLTIFRANFWNISIDDLPRQIEGSREWMNWYRYVSEIGSIFIHTSKQLIDIAPLTQLLATFLVSLSSFFIIYIFNKKFTYFSCFAVLPVGLFPYFLSNISYRYDSPYMALAMLVSIIPFLFIDDYKTFIPISVIGLFLMCTSYQSASGIYIFMSMLCVFKFFIFKEKSIISLLKTTAVCILCYGLTLYIFSKVFIPKPDTVIYADESLDLRCFIPNTINYLKYILNNFKGTTIFTFTILLFILFFVFSIIKSSANKIITTFVTILLVILGTTFTFGSYLGLAKPLYSARAFTGIGVFIGALSVITISEINLSSNKILILPKLITAILSYSLLAFSFAYGNAQADQKNYIDFRTTLLLKDLSEVVESTDDKIEFLFVSNIGYAKTVQNLIDVYPVAEELIDIALKPHRPAEFILESYNFCDLKAGSNNDFTNEDLPVLIENQYNKIQGKNNQYLITFKNPQLKVIKTRNIGD